MARAFALILALLLAARRARGGRAGPVAQADLLRHRLDQRHDRRPGAARRAPTLYSLKATAGQTLTVTITAPDDNAVFQVYEPGTTRRPRQRRPARVPRQDAARRGATATTPRAGSGRLPKSGTYLIVVGSTRGNARYSMDVKIE